MIVLFDLDDTLLDHTGAERQAALAFAQHFGGAARLSDDAFVACWQAAATRHYRHFQAGELSFAEQQRQKLVALGIPDRFAVVVTCEQAGCAKPDPRIFHAGCARLGTDPAKCIYVGDQLDGDARVAQSAGLRGVWLDRGVSVMPATDVAVIHSLLDLLALVEPSGEGREASALPRRLVVTAGLLVGAEKRAGRPLARNLLSKKRKSHAPRWLWGRPPAPACRPEHARPRCGTAASHTLGTTDEKEHTPCTRTGLGPAGHGPWPWAWC